MKLSKKILKSLLALPISAFMILMIYSFMYLALGEELYTIEIEALKDFYVLIKEFLVLATSILIAIFVFQISYENIKEKENKASIRILHMLILFIFSALLPIILAYYLLADLELFSYVFLILWSIIVAIIALIFAVKDFIDVWIINRKLNKKN